MHHPALGSGCSSPPDYRRNRKLVKQLHIEWILAIHRAVHVADGVPRLPILDMEDLMLELAKGVFQCDIFGIQALSNQDGQPMTAVGTVSEHLIPTRVFAYYNIIVERRKVSFRK